MNWKYSIAALIAVTLAGCQSPEKTPESGIASSEASAAPTVAQGLPNSEPPRTIKELEAAGKTQRVQGNDEVIATPKVATKPIPTDSASMTATEPSEADNSGKVRPNSPVTPPTAKPPVKVNGPKPQTVTNLAEIGLSPYPGSTVPAKNGVAQKTKVDKDTFYTFGRNSKDEPAKILAYYQTKLKPGSKIDAPIKSKDTVTTILKGQTQDGAKAMIAVTRRKDLSFIFVSVQRNK